MVPDGDFLATFCVLYFQQAACSTFQTCILNSHLGHTMCGSMADIQSATAEIRRGKTSSWAATERLREPLSQLKSCQLLHNCTKNHSWLEGLPFHVV